VSGMVRTARRTHPMGGLVALREGVPGGQEER
jgi:hypothetical protein